MRKTFLSCLLILLFFVPGNAQTTAVVIDQKSSALSVEIKQQTFDKVWRTINERHFDPTFGGVDWKKVGETYEPKVMAAKTDAEFYALLQEMLGELHQSHFTVVPPWAQITPSVSGEGEIGIDLQMIEKDAVITRVNADSTAAKSGLKTGFVIQKIDGKTTAEILAPLEEKLLTRKVTDAAKMLFRRRALLAVLSGKPATVVKVETLDAQNKVQTFEIERAPYTGEMSAPMGNFPAQRVIFESKRLPGNIGYVRFNIWVTPHMAKLRDAIRSMSDTKGLIIDLRGNPGGLGMMTTALASFLVNKQTSLGTSKSRKSESSFDVNPQENPFGGSIIILTDSGTGSASEVFAAGMQGIGRAKIVGEKSAGAVLPSVIEKLPAGATFLYAISDYKSPNKILIEGRGITPDVEVKLTRKSLLEGRDLQLEAAIKEIGKGSEKIARSVSVGNYFFYYQLPF